MHCRKKSTCIQCTDLWYYTHHVACKLRSTPVPSSESCSFQRVFCLGSVRCVWTDPHNVYKITTTTTGPTQTPVPPDGGDVSRTHSLLPSTPVPFVPTTSQIEEYASRAQMLTICSGGLNTALYRRNNDWTCDRPAATTITLIISNPCSIYRRKWWQHVQRSID